MTQITKEAIEAAHAVLWERDKAVCSQNSVEAALTAALPFLSTIAGKPDMLRLAVAAVLEADKEFRANMPPEWEGDPLSDEIDGLRRVFSSTLPIVVEGKVKALEWVVMREGDEIAETILGTYTITGGSIYLVWFAGQADHEDYAVSAPSMDAAKSFAQSDYETRILSALASSPGKDGGQEVEALASIVPHHCSGYSFVFEPGVLHVKKDGSGHIVVNEGDFVLEDDRCEGPDGPEGSIHWIARMDASEIIALRDFLNGSTSAIQPASTALVERLTSALTKLEREASEVSKIGAKPGTQWTRLAGALINARSALSSSSTSREGER